ncbi:MAG TPA: class I SAM-dependent rRNA methyltransferase [Pirellulales bacterium]|nr:class I SAM-dependent rRNA methyltransferase [Pirellulales bacterium]
MPTIVLKPRKARPFYGRHPWVLDSAVERVEGQPADGDVVELLANDGGWIARGIFNNQSRIRVRLYTWRREEPLDRTFWRRRLQAALAFRQAHRHRSSSAGRLVFSEADGLSGLVVDRYGDYLVMQVSALAMAQRIEELLSLADELLRPRGIMLRVDQGVGALEGLPTGLVEGPCWGEPPSGPVFIEEHGIRYGVDLTAGQKTGFFLDQRDNRLAAAGYLHGRSVLDLFCYTGGFALCASLRGGAAEVLGVDSSAKAIALAKANAQLNGVANVRFETGDGFQTLEQLASEGRRFGGIVLDPPKFARRRQGLPDALRAYHKLNERAVELLEPNGVLVTCSCSGYVTREDFQHVLAEVAQRTSRNVQILEARGAAPDHPTSVTCLETEYLKCFICRVE